MTRLVVSAFSVVWMALNGAMVVRSFSSMTDFKLILLDRDGVVNVDVGSPGVVSPSQLRLTPGAAAAVGTLQRAGCRVVLVTNQSCVGKGIITKKELDGIHECLQRMLLEQDPEARLDQIYCCTSTTNVDDDRRKPGPGMILEACRDFHADPGSDCVMVGDTINDLLAAQTAGVQTRVLVSTGYGQSIMGFRPEPNQLLLLKDTNDNNLSVPSPILPFYYVENLASAVMHNGGNE